MLDKLFTFDPVEIPIEGELKPVEVALIKSVRNLEIAMVKISTIWVGALVIVGAVWGVGGYVFAQKLEEYSATVKTTVQMEVEIQNIKARLNLVEFNQRK